MEKLFTLQPIASYKANSAKTVRSDDWSALGFLKNPTLGKLQDALDLTTIKINLTSDNIVNVQTPGYKAKRLSFGDVLSEKSKSFRSDALREKYNKTALYNGLRYGAAKDGPRIYTDPSSQTLIDGNSVDINHENLELARTKLEYDYLVRKISDEYALLKHAVSEGKG